MLGAYEPRPPGSPFGESAERVRGDSAGTAALAVEIVDADHGEERLAALAADRIDEVVLVDVGARTSDGLALADGQYRSTDASRVIDLRPAALAESVNWPSDPSPLGIGRSERGAGRAPYSSGYRPWRRLCARS